MHLRLLRLAYELVKHQPPSLKPANAAPRTPFADPPFPEKFEPNHAEFVTLPWDIWDLDRAESETQARDMAKFGVAGTGATHGGGTWRKLRRKPCSPLISIFSEPSQPPDRALRVVLFFLSLPEEARTVSVPKKKPAQ